jgi:hypothetical protein
MIVCHDHAQTISELQLDLAPKRQRKTPGFPNRDFCSRLGLNFFDVNRKYNDN